jgi:hypothetical protein
MAEAGFRIAGGSERAAFPEPVSSTPSRSIPFGWKSSKGPIRASGGRRLRIGWDDALPVRIDERDGFGGLPGR